jgi:hypothetical protein
MRCNSVIGLTTHWQLSLSFHREAQQHYCVSRQAISYNLFSQQIWRLCADFALKVSAGFTTVTCI